MTEQEFNTQMALLSSLQRTIQDHSEAFKSIEQAIKSQMNINAAMMHRVNSLSETIEQLVNNDTVRTLSEMRNES